MTHPEQTAATPGPWKVEDYTQDVSRPTFYVVPATYYGTVAKTDNPANARLIAAAPDMLEALRGIGNLLKERPDIAKAIWPLMGPAEHEAFAKARAAISRAEGRTEPKAGE